MAAPLTTEENGSSRFTWPSPRSPCNLNECVRREILEHFEVTFDMYEYVFASIVEEKYYYAYPNCLRLPLIFYLGHTSAFYMNKLMLAGLIDTRLNMKFDTLFETGVDENSWDDTESYRLGGSIQWPSLADVLDYRRKVKEVVINVIENEPLELPITQEHPWWSVFLGIEHERLHLETTSVLLHELPVEFLKRPEGWKYAPVTMEEPSGSNELVEVPPGKVTLGKPSGFPSYGWDIEYGQLEVNVPAFTSTRYLVTNRDFGEFVRDGGYQRRDVWSKEGWEWVQGSQAKHPSFWVCGDGCSSRCGSDLCTYSHCNLKECTPQRTCTTSDNTADPLVKYRYRAVFDVLDLPLDWPVEVNFHEAKAFCRWKGPEYRLPTEAEHHRMRGHPAPSTDSSCDPAVNGDFPANNNLKLGSPNPVNMYPPSPMGFHDVYGNLWEWVEDHINGFPGFKPCYLYEDYSANSFDGLHNMILGGSWVSTGGMTSRFHRSWFRRHFHQHSGFRLVKSSGTIPVRLCRSTVFVPGSDSQVTEDANSAPGIDPEMAYVQSMNTHHLFDQESELERILELQYGKPDVYTGPLIQLVEDAVRRHKGSTSRAVNFGCGPGHTSFLLTKTFEKVVGVDYCGRFIDAAEQLQQGKPLEYGLPRKVAAFPHNSGVDMSIVTFQQLTWLPNEIHGFDLVLFESIERFIEPKGWLRKLWECITPRGLLVIVGTNHWDGKRLETFIAKWFTLLEEVPIGSRTATIWQLKSM